MAPSLPLALALLLALCSCLLSLVWASSARLDLDIKDSLKNNIVGCPYNLVHLNYSIMKTEKSDEFVVRSIVPTKHEIELFQKFPVSLTQANKQLAENAEAQGYNAKWTVESTVNNNNNNNAGLDRKTCLNMTNLAATEKIISFYEAYKHSQRGFYVMHARNAFIHPTGSVALSCGYFAGNEGCEIKASSAAEWYEKCKGEMKKDGITWGTLFADKTPSDKVKTMMNTCAYSSVDSPSTSYPTVTRHSKVFTIPAIWDDNYHHFITDSLVRLARNYRYLRTHTDVKVHIRAYEVYNSNKNHLKDSGYNERAKKMRTEFFELLGISEARIISGPVLADEVFIPRFMKCSSLLSNPAELRILNKQLTINANGYLHQHPEVKEDLFNSMSIEASKELRGARFRNYDDMLANNITVNITSSFTGKTRRMVVYQQYTSGHSTATEWNDQTFNEVVKSFEKAFPNHLVMRLSSRDLDSDKHCLACDITRYSHADVLVAAHGPGLTNMIFLKPGALVIEIVGEVGANNMPVCGYYGPMAAGLGLHHYLHAYDFKMKKNIGADECALKASGFYKLLRDPTVKKDVVKVAV
jgi:hypothetical protein